MCVSLCVSFIPFRCVRIETVAHLSLLFATHIYKLTLINSSSFRNPRPPPRLHNGPNPEPALVVPAHQVIKRQELPKVNA